MILSAVAVIAAGAMSGCVSKKNYAQLQADYTQLGKDYQSSQVSLAESRAKVQSLEQRLADAQKNNAELKQAYAAVQKSLDNAVYQGGANISKLVDEINSSNRYIQQPHALALARRTPRRRRKGAQRRGLHLARRQYALSQRLV